MWSIVSTESEETKHDFLVDEEYIVGRKDCPILIAGDQSISRRHAVLRVQHPEAHLNNLGAPSALLLKETSKYGSSLNGAKLEAGSETHLKDGDQIVFGVFKTNKWRVKHAPLVVAASALHAEEKRSLKRVVLALGGHMVSEWGLQCTHLVMSQLNVTVKVIGALVACRPIVTPDFCKRFVDAIKEKAPFPDADQYLPPVAEAAINKDEVSFSPNERRKTIFEGKTFFFLTQKQFKRLHVVISMAGGQSELLDEDSDLESLVPRLVSADSCVLYTQHQDRNQASQDVASETLHILKKHKLRPIPESELGLAILYISTALHCNPRVAQAGLDLLSAAPSQSLPTQNILALDTQSLSQQIHGDGRGHSGNACAEEKEEPASASNRPTKNITSTPKISKISESIMEASSSVTPGNSARMQGSSPEFSFQGKTQAKEETTKSVKTEGGRPTRPGSSSKSGGGDSRRTESGESGGEKRDGFAVPAMKVKQEILSQDVDSKTDRGGDVARRLSAQPKEERRGRGEDTDMFKEKKNLSRQKQSSLQMFMRAKDQKEETKDEGREKDHAKERGKVRIGGKGEDGVENQDVEGMENGAQHQERKGGARDRRWEAEDERAGRTPQVKEEPKEEPMDLAETEQLPLEAGETDRESERGRGTPARERKAPGGKRSGKRKSLWSGDDDDDDGRGEMDNGGQTNGRRKAERDAGSSLWKKKARVDVFSQEEEEENSAPLDQGNVSGFPDSVSDIPRGFISARVPIGDQLNVKVEKDYIREEELPTNLIQIKETALIVRKERNPRGRAAPVEGPRGAVKNFKKFRKAKHAGQSSMPRIIGGRDLFAHQNNPSKDIEEMFNEEVRTEKTRDKQEEMADRLFAFEPRRPPLAKRRR